MSDIIGYLTSPYQSSSCLDCFVNNATTGYGPNGMMIMWGAWWCNSGVIIPGANLVDSGQCLSAASYAYSRANRTLQSPLSDTCIQSVQHCDNPTVMSESFAGVFFGVLFTALVAYGIALRRYREQRLFLAWVANALVFGLCIILSAFWWIDLFHGGLTTYRTVSNIRLGWIPLFIFGLVSLQGEILTRNWGQPTPPQLKRLKVITLWKTDCLGQVGRLFIRYLPISRARATNLAFCAILWALISGVSIFDSPAYAVFLLSEKKYLYAYAPVPLVFLISLCSHWVPWMHVRWRGVRALSAKVEKEEEVLASLDSATREGFDFSDAEVLKRPVALRRAFRLRSALMVVFLPSLALCVLSVFKLYGKLVAVRGFPGEFDDANDDPRLPEVIYTMNLFFGVSAIAVNFYIFYENFMIYRYWELALLNNPDLSEGSELNEQELPLLISSDDAEGESKDDILKRNRHTGHMLAGIQAVSPIMTLLAMGLAGFAIILAVGAWSDPFEGSILHNVITFAQYIKPETGLQIRAAIKPYVTIWALVALGHAIACVMQQYAFASRARRSKNTVQAGEDDRPYLGQEATEEATKAVLDIIGPQRNIVGRALLWMASWHGQQFLTLFSHLSTFLVSLFGLVSNEFRGTSFSFAIATTIITGVGTFITLTTFLSRTWHFLKFYPTDDSFRITILLKASLLVLKSMLLLVSPTGYDLIYLVLFSLSLLTLAVFTFVNVLAAWRRREIFYDIRYPRLLLVGFACCYVWNKVASLALVAISFSVGRSTSGNPNSSIITVLFIGSVIVLISYTNNEVARYLQGRMTADRNRRDGKQAAGVTFYGLARSCGGLAFVLPYVLLFVSSLSLVFLISGTTSGCYGQSGSTPCLIGAAIYKFLLIMGTLFVAMLQVSLLAGFDPVTVAKVTRYIAEGAKQAEEKLASALLAASKSGEDGNGSDSDSSAGNKHTDARGGEGNRRKGKGGKTSG